MSATPFALSISDNCRSNNVTRLTFLKLSDFAAFINSVPPVADKLHSKGIIASLFNSNVRTVENITSVTSATLDFDTPSEGLFDAVTAILEGEGISHVAFGTWSNHGRFAVVVPFARPTSIAGHAATVEHLRALLGAYASFAPESSRPGQLRFISPNADNEYRSFNVFDGALLVPVEPVEEVVATSTSFESFGTIATPGEKNLFLIALRNNLLPEKRLDVYEDWYPVVFAAFRAWGIGKKKGDVTEHQQEMLEALNLWSSKHEKWKPGCVEAKIGDHLRAGAKTMTIQSLLKMEVEQTRMTHFISADQGFSDAEKRELGATYSRLIGGQSITCVATVDPTAIEEAQGQRAAEQSKQDAERKWAMGILSRMPAPTKRFAEFRDILTELTTQGRHEFWELDPEGWHDFLRPVPMLMSLVQVAALGFMPHVLFRQSDAIEAKALNLFFLNIARAGTGKSITLDVAGDILRKTIYRNCNPREKLHSATGLWVNHFERTGNLQLMTSDEAESMFGKAGQQDQHLHALHTAIKQLFDGGIPGKTYRPSAQVQREIAELTAPTLLLNLAGTPALLNGDISGAMMFDGFMSRMVTYINDAESDTESEEQAIARAVELMQGKVGNSREQSIVKAANFFKQIWKDGLHPQGPAIFDAPVDADREFLINTIREHFENPDIEPRYIRPGRTYEDLMAVAKLEYKAKHRFNVPAGLSGTDAEPCIESLKQRAGLKLFMLTTVLTLIAEPEAEYLNLEIMAWAEEFLYVAQRDFYNHMIGNNSMGLSVLPKYRINPDMMKALRPAVLPKGPLHGGGLVKSATMNAFSRPWRRLLADLKCDETSERFKCATELLIELGVAYQDGENNARLFFIRPEAKD